MKHLAVLLFVFGCATTQPSPDQSVSNASSPDIAQTSQPTSAGVPCSQEIARECSSGVDGCLRNLTTTHVCVSANAKTGASCSQEVAMQCGPGEIDACLLSPAPATHHICVVR